LLWGQTTSQLTEKSAENAKSEKYISHPFALFAPFAVEYFALFALFAVIYLAEEC